MFPDAANAGLPLDRQPKAITGVSMERIPLMGFVISLFTYEYQDVRSSFGSVFPQHFSDSRVSGDGG